jgi:general secretion pathway protein K
VRAFLPCQNNNSVQPFARQRGTVLVLVLLIVALVAALSVKFASQYQLGLARAESRWHGAQARAFLEGTEEVAKLMFSVADNDPNLDFLGEDWGAQVPIEDDGVTGVAQLVDATAQLNLNDLITPLVTDKPMGDAGRYSEPQRRFIRLLQTFPDLQLNQNEAEYLLEAVLDWMDADDNESGMGGAESNYYQGLKNGYLPANAPFKSVDELRLVRGFNDLPYLVLRLQAFVTVLPGDKVGINVNTIEPISPFGEGINNLLQTLNDANSLEPLSPTEAEQFITDRPETGFPEAGAISESWNKLFSGRNLVVDGLNVKTDYFWLNATVQLVDQRRSMRSLMQRGEGNSLKVIQRDDVFELPTVVRNDKDNNSGRTELVN